ncbi:uncharacterized protein LOC131615059 [Vicia villosa]|uniref:uncharacterized protein LOC131615059 n=1 Tax=Vicia villosa TaxID=3911 RepID=UPI00273C3F4F|nr:uncharacterized protein LOC131615059 [Vicia villosa]
MANAKQWNIDVVRKLFYAADTEKILQVLLLEEVKRDRLIWKAERDGTYSVKTGYKLWYHVVISREEVGGSEDWGSIWNIKAPPRVEYPLWRICRDCIPTRERLRQHVVMCPSNIKSLIFYICSKEGKEVSGRFAVMIDVIWKNRNDYIWHNEQEEATKLGVKAAHIWNDSFQAQEDSTNNVRPHHALDWSAPSVGWLKCNVDATFNSNNDIIMGCIPGSQESINLVAFLGFSKVYMLISI